MRPQVLIITFQGVDTDVRVLKQIDLFGEHYDVTTCGHGPQPAGTVAHVEIPAGLEAWVKDPKWLLARQYRRVYTRNPAIAYARAHLRPGTWDVVVANNPEAVPLALSLRPRGGVHADLHEYAPGTQSDVRRWRWFVAPYYRWLCRRYVARADSVTTVGPAIAGQYQREFGFECGVVLNATPYHELPVGEVASPIKLVHSGNARASRNLELTIDAVVASEVPVTLDLYLMPNDPQYLERLRQRAAASERVTVRDPVPYHELIQTLNGYDVGVFFLPPLTENYRWTLPNKLFDYVQARLGVVIGPSQEMVTFVQEYGLGAVAAGFGVEDLTEVLSSLTVARVQQWRQAADAAAWPLSAEQQCRPWAQAVAALVAKAQGKP